jgi:hypothetical protein
MSEKSEPKEIDHSEGATPEKLAWKEIAGNRYSPEELLAMQTKWPIKLHPQMRSHRYQCD